MGASVDRRYMRSCQNVQVALKIILSVMENALVLRLDLKTKLLLINQFKMDHFDATFNETTFPYQNLSNSFKIFIVRYIFFCRFTYFTRLIPEYLCKCHLKQYECSELPLTGLLACLLHEFLALFLLLF